MATKRKKTTTARTGAKRAGKPVTSGKARAENGGRNAVPRRTGYSRSVEVGTASARRAATRRRHPG